MCLSDRNPYVLFVREMMQKGKFSDFNSKTNRLTECSQSWSKLSPEEKQHYTDLRNLAMQQYLADVEEFKKVFMVYKCNVCVCASTD